MGRTCSEDWGEEECIYDLGAKRERKRPVGRPRNRWVDNIKMNLREIGWGGMNWIDLGQNRDQRRGLVNTVMNLLVLYNFGKFLCSSTRWTLLHGVLVNNFTKYISCCRNFIILQCRLGVHVCTN
jgi:hypothetical protein